MCHTSSVPYILSLNAHKCFGFSQKLLNEILSYSKSSSARQRTREIRSIALQGELVSKCRVTRLGGACSPLGRSTWPQELNFCKDKSAGPKKCQSCSGPGKFNCNRIVWICSFNTKMFLSHCVLKPAPCHWGCHVQGVAHPLGSTRDEVSGQLSPSSAEAAYSRAAHPPQRAEIANISCSLSGNGSVQPVDPRLLKNL